MNNDRKSIAIAESDFLLYNPVVQEVQLEGLSPEEQAETKKMWNDGREVVKFLNEEKRKDNQEVLDLFDSFKEESSTPSSKSLSGASLGGAASTSLPSGYYHGADGSISSSSYKDNSKFKAEQAAWRENNRKKREAIAAKTEAEKAKEEELLGSGLYFKDGYGKIRMKKRVSEKMFGKYLDMSEKTAYDIKKAGADAYASEMQGNSFGAALRAQEQERVAKGRNRTSEIVKANKEELANQEILKQERAKSAAKGNLAIFDGLVAAFNALGEDPEMQKKRSREIITGGVLRGANGKVVGAGGVKKDHMASMQEAARGEGSAPKWGYVGVDTIGKINARLKETGNKHIAITGIIARQDTDATGNKMEPTFYVQGVRQDGSKFGREMKLSDVYSLGKKNYMDTGWSEYDAYNEVSGIFGDAIGEGKRITQEYKNKNASTIAEAQTKLRKNEFDMRNSHLNSLMRQRKALLEQEGDNSKAIAAIDSDIATVNSMNSAALGVSEFARALGVTGLGGKDPNQAGYETVSTLEETGGREFAAEDEVESDGQMKKRVQYNPESGEYTVNTKHRQPDGSYAFRVSKDKAHLGEKWVTYVDEDGKVKQREREEADGYTEQHDNGLYLKGKKANGETVEIFVPAGKVVKTAFGTKRVDGEKGNYTLVDTDEKPNWTAREAIIANWANRDTEEQKKKTSSARKKEDALYEAKDKADFKKEHPVLSAMSDMSDSTLLSDGYSPIFPADKGVGSAKQGRQKYKKRSTANWGARRRGATYAVQKANEMLDKLVAEKSGISVEEARKLREADEAKKLKETRR